jgi:aminomethyltransferase
VIDSVRGELVEPLVPFVYEENKLVQRFLNLQTLFYWVIIVYVIRLANAMLKESELKQTSLYPHHLELGGKMTAFAGYQLPIQYPTGIIHEHLYCRSHAGFFDISHMGQFLISGKDAASELERLTPSKITGLKPGQQKYTVLTNDAGGVIDDIIVTRVENGIRLIVNAACKSKDFDYLLSRLSGRCQLTELTELSLFALQGPASAAVIGEFSASAAQLPFMSACETEIAGINCTISRCGYTGEDGFEISVANDHAETLARLLLAEKEIKPVGLGARDTLRLEAGLCLYGHELNENITPIEAGLSWLISKGRDDYPGAEKILKQLKEGTKIIRAGLIADSKMPVREGSIIVNKEGIEIGTVSSGTFSPSLNKPVAMAFLDKHYSDIGTQLAAKVRDKLIPVTVVALPFVPHRYQR